MTMTTSCRYRPLSGCGSSATGAIISRQHHSMVVVVFLPIILLLSALLAVAPGTADGAGGSGVCDGGCQNGGKLLLPNNLLGYCRCRCPPDYKGPKCQYTDKRSGYPSLVAFVADQSGNDDADTRSEAAVVEGLFRAVNSLSRRKGLRGAVRLPKRAVEIEPLNGLTYRYRANNEDRK